MDALKYVAVLAMAGGLLSGRNEPAFGQSLFAKGDGHWYGSAFVGAALPSTVGVGAASDLGLNLDLDLSLDFETSLYFGGAFGGRLPVRIFGLIQPRTEVEVSYFDTDTRLDGREAIPPGLPALLGADALLAEVTTISSVETLRVDFNLLLDIRWSKDQSIIPYAGGGIGAAFLSSDPNTDRLTTFSHNIAAGLSFPIVRRLELYTEGRYFQIHGIEGDTFAADFEGFTATGGVRVRF